jgi:NTE family protein
MGIGGAVPRPRIVAQRYRVQTRESSMSMAFVKQAIDEFRTSSTGQVVLVLQGGGALGAYQAGVYQALHEAGVELDWIIGTSIGAINASLIAGNKFADRLVKLEEFWKRMERPSAGSFASAWPGLSDTWSWWPTIVDGIPAFFKPNLRAFWAANVPLGVDHAALYSTDALRKTLSELVDFSIINKGSPRLTVGAANVETSMMHYFDSRETPIGTEQIMASGALPPAFPAIKIDDQFFWDGGILSNTPTEVIFDDVPRRNSLIFAVHLWNPKGPVPRSVWEALHRQKDIQYSSRIASHIARQQQTHRLRHVISQLVEQIPAERRSNNEAMRELAGYGCKTQMHVVRLLAPRIESENHTKDIDFSPSSIRARHQAGYRATVKALERAPWRGDFDPIEGVILHEAMSDFMAAAE